MLCVYGHYEYFYSYSVGIDSESDVYRRQILTSKIDPRAVRVNDIHSAKRISDGLNPLTTGAAYIRV